MTDIEYSSANNYELLNETDKSALIKIDYNSLIQFVKHWCYNREVIESVVDNLYNSISEDNNIIWVLTAVKERENDELYLIDGQHRYEAIRRKLSEDIDFKIEKFLYINIYYVDNINESDEYIIDLITKINKTAPFNIPDFPSKRNIKLINKMIKDPIFKKGISINDKTNTANQPNIHRKTLHSKFNELNAYIKDLDDETIIENLKRINKYIGLKSFKDIYPKEEQTKQANKNAWEKANEMKFYLGFKYTQFIIDNIIKNISNPIYFN
jgi:hypothetical protein